MEEKIKELESSIEELKDVINGQSEKIETLEKEIESHEGGFRFIFEKVRDIQKQYRVRIIAAGKYFGVDIA